MCKMYERREKEKISRQFAYYCLLYIYRERIRIHNVDNWCIAIVEEQKGGKFLARFVGSCCGRLVSIVMIVLHTSYYSSSSTSPSKLFLLF